MKTLREMMDIIESAQNTQTEGILGDQEHRRVMPFVKRIAGEVSDYDRDEFGEELWSLLDQRYGAKFAQSVLADLDFYWDTYTELTGQQGVAEGSHQYHVVSKLDGAVLASYKTKEDAQKNAHGNPVVSGSLETIGDRQYVREQGLAEEQLEETPEDPIAKIEELFRDKR